MRDSQGRFIRQSAVAQYQADLKKRLIKIFDKEQI